MLVRCLQSRGTDEKEKEEEEREEGSQRGASRLMNEFATTEDVNGQTWRTSIHHSHPLDWTQTQLCGVQQGNTGEEGGGQGRGGSMLQAYAQQRKRGFAQPGRNVTIQRCQIYDQNTPPCYDGPQCLKGYSRSAAANRPIDPLPSAALQPPFPLAPGSQGWTGSFVPGSLSPPATACRLVHLKGLVCCSSRVGLSWGPRKEGATSNPTSCSPRICLHA